MTGKDPYGNLQPASSTHTTSQPTNQSNGSQRAKANHEFEDEASSGDEVTIRFQKGAVVAAKLGSYPYWPAMIDTEPDTSEFYWVETRKETLSPKQATHYNVVFFDAKGKVTRRWITDSMIVEYTDHFPTGLTEKKIRQSRKLPARQRDLIEARRLAEEALKLDVAERIQKYSFVNTYTGRIAVYDDNGTPKLVKSSASMKSGKNKAPALKSLTLSLPTCEVRLTKDGKIRQKPGRKPGNKNVNGEKTEPLPQQPSSSRSNRRSTTATSEPSKPDPTHDHSQPAQKSEPVVQPKEPSSLKLRITKDKTNGKNYSSKTVPVSNAGSNEPSAELSELAPQSLPETEVPAHMPKKRGKKRKAKSKSAAKKPKYAEKAQPPEPSGDTKRPKSAEKAQPPEPPGASKKPKSAEKAQPPEPPGASKKPKADSPQSPDPSPVAGPSFPEEVICLSDGETELEPSFRKTYKRSSSLRRLSQASGSHPTPKPVVLANLAIEPPATEERQIGVAFPFQQVPPEETMEFQMSSVLERAHSQFELPARLLTNKTLSNLGLVVGKDPVIDLTGDDDYEPETIPWELGEVVFAHLNGLQPWPAVVEADKSFDNKYISPVTGPPELLHVTFLELKKSAWVPLKNVEKFSESNLEVSSNYSVKFDRALQMAEKAMLMSRLNRIAVFGTSGNSSTLPPL